MLLICLEYLRPQSHVTSHSADSQIEKIRKQLAQILGIKTFVTKDISEMKRVIERLIKENLSNYSSAEKLHLIAILSE